MGAGGKVATAVYDGNGSTGWTQADESGLHSELVLNLDQPLDGARELNLELLFERHYVVSLGRLRVSVTTSGRTQRNRKNTGQRRTLMPAQSTRSPIQGPFS